MKTKNLFLVTMVALFAAVVESSGQASGNVVFGPNNITFGGWNVLLGYETGMSIPTGTSTFSDIFIGSTAGKRTTTGDDNIFIGYATGQYNKTGTGNTFVGSESGAMNDSALQTVTNYNYNTGIGFKSGGMGENNINIGALTGLGNQGSNNIYLGLEAGYCSPQLNVSGNVFIGQRAGKNYNASNRLSINGAAPYGYELIYGEFDNRKLKFNVNNGVGPFTSYLELNGNANASGLRFTNMKSSTASITNPTNKILSVNTDGDVILVNDKTGGVTQNCSTANFVPVNSATAGQLNCSQIFDNGTSVGIGTTGTFNYSYNTGDFLALAPASGTAKLRVNGVAWTTGYYASSDQKFKKDIKPIENALEKVQQIEGKTYAWNTESNKDMNFDNGGHSGFIAQELEKVLPHLVATDEKGNKAVNYIELMPYLIEAIKDQQTQINDLKSQITENFKAQNQDLIELTNTKIISVSPNPSSDMITVSFNVEKLVDSAKLQVHDLNGNVISSLNISDRENNITRTLQKDNFGKGIYVVSLVINGKSIDTKKIVFN